MHFDRRAFIATLAALACAPAAAAETGLRSGQPSATARGAALSRALHQLLDAPPVFEDRFAVPVVAPVSPAELRATLESSRALRASIALRSRYAEDLLAQAVAGGVRQYVVLGAGLDTFALRNPHRPKGLRVFEVDHPATQAFKRERLSALKIGARAGTVFVPVDFETQDLRTQLRRGGVRLDRPVFFSMLGVVIYLTDEAVMATMDVVRQCARGSRIAFSYSVPHDQLGEAQLAARRRSMERVAAAREPWITFYDPGTLAARLRDRGFRATHDLTPEEANQRYFANRPDGLKVGGGHVMLAQV